MLGRGAGILVALVWATTVRAQTVTLRFEGPGPREAWIASSPPEGEPSTRVASQEASLALPLPSANPKNRIYVHDLKSGRLAVLPIGKSPMMVAGRAFGHVYRTLVSVEHKGKPVAAGLVTVDDSERKQAQFLAPGDKGKVSFYGLKLGSIKVEVQYKSGETKRTTPAQTFEFAPDPDRPEPVLTVSIPEEVAVVEEPSKAESKPVEPPKPAAASGGSILGTLVVMAFGIAAVVGLVWAFFHFAKKNPDALKANLERLGVQVPDGQGADDEDDVPPPAPAGPRPVEPIILDPSAAPAAAAVPMMNPVREPALVDASGHRWRVPEGICVVGRDDGLDLSLAGESTVSRRHAEIVRSGGALSVRDLGSTNGTFVNGIRIEAETPLTLGDTVQFGSVRFRVEG